MFPALERNHHVLAIHDDYIYGIKKNSLCTYLGVLMTFVDSSVLIGTEMYIEKRRSRTSGLFNEIPALLL